MFHHADVSTAEMEALGTEIALEALGGPFPATLSALFTRSLRGLEPATLARLVQRSIAGNPQRNDAGRAYLRRLADAFVAVGPKIVSVSDSVAKACIESWAEKRVARVSVANMMAAVDALDLWEWDWEAGMKWIDLNYQAASWDLASVKGAMRVALMRFTVEVCQLLLAEWREFERDLRDLAVDSLR